MSHRIPSGLLALSACAAAALVILPPDALAFVWLGTSMPFDGRDVRVFNNFADPESNDNVTPHATWPGAIGATQAIWKGVSEWGSAPHGDGEGDPSQPGGIGSGGANFDVNWGGLATGIGPTDGNTVSAIASCGGGITVIVESSPSGWRMRLCDNLLWDDGPGTVLAPGALDIQATVTHEYGHLLGLGHSNVGGSTMFATISGNGVSMRSIEADDKAGIQFIYGAAAPTKPRIDSALPGALLVISGANFGAAGNEVWFTPAGPNPSGAPLVVSGVSSTLGGTRIALAIPAGAGPGDVLVRAPGAATGAILSNAFPLDPNGCPPPAVYCAAKTSSQGCVPAISAVGTPSASAGSGFVVACDGVPSGMIGLLFYSRDGAAAVPFQGGTLCLSGALTRTPGQGSGGTLPAGSACDGHFDLDFNAWIASGADPLLALDSTVWSQWWFRDPGFAPPNASGLSDAVAFLVCP
jgi:hypothetical protein